MAKHPVIHFEIVTHDVDSLSSFFRDAFDWSLADSGSPGGGGVTKYIIARPTGEDVPQGYGINGGFGSAPEGYDGHVTFYIQVNDIEAALQKVESLGGTRIMGPEQVPNGPMIGLFKDPQGHTIGLVDPQM